MKKDQHLGLHDNWNKGYQYQREALWQCLVAKGRKQSDKQNSGFMSLIAILIFAFSMASIAINNEAILYRLETTAEERK